MTKFGAAPNGLAAAAIALVALPLPGMLPFWDALRTGPSAQAWIVVALLAAAGAPSVLA